MSHQTPPVGSWTRHPFLLVQVSIAFSPCHSTPGWTCKTCKTEGRRAHQHAHAFDLPPSRAHPCPKRCRNRHPTPVVKQCFWNKTRGHVSIDASLGASMGSGLSPGGSRGTSEKDTFDGIPPTFPQNLNQQMAAETRAHAFTPHWHANMKPWFANMKLFKSTRNSISWENVVCRVSIYVSICMQLVCIYVFSWYIYICQHFVWIFRIPSQDGMLMIWYCCVYPCSKPKCGTFHGTCMKTTCYIQTSPFEDRIRPWTHLRIYIWSFVAKYISKSFGCLHAPPFWADGTSLLESSSLDFSSPSMCVLWEVRQARRRYIKLDEFNSIQNLPSNMHSARTLIWTPESWEPPAFNGGMSMVTIWGLIASSFEACFQIPLVSLGFLGWWTLVFILVLHHAQCFHHFSTGSFKPLRLQLI